MKSIVVKSILFLLCATLAVGAIVLISKSMQNSVEEKVVPTSTDFISLVKGGKETLNDSFTLYVSKQLVDSYTSSAEVLIRYGDTSEEMVYQGNKILSGKIYYEYDFERELRAEEMKQQLAETGTYGTQYDFVFKYGQEEYKIDTENVERQVMDIAKAAIVHSEYKRGCGPVSEENAELIGRARWRFQVNGEILMLLDELGYEVDIGLSAYVRALNDTYQNTSDIVVRWDSENGYRNAVQSATVMEHLYNSVTGNTENSTGIFDESGNYAFNYVLLVQPSDYIDVWKLQVEAHCFIGLKKNDGVSVCIGAGSLSEVVAGEDVPRMERMNAIAKCSEYEMEAGILRVKIPKNLLRNVDPFAKGDEMYKFAVGVVAIPVADEDVAPSVEYTYREDPLFKIAEGLNGEITVIASAEKGTHEGFVDSSEYYEVVCDVSNVVEKIQAEGTSFKLRVFYAAYSGRDDIAYSDVFSFDSGE